MHALERERVGIRGLYRRMYAVLFNIHNGELELGTLNIDLRKWVYHGK